VYPLSGFSAPIGVTVAGLLNHLLEGQPWLREGLIPFSGCAVRVEIAPVLLILTVGPDGVLVMGNEDAQPDVTVCLSLLTLMRLVGGDDAARVAVEVSGDSALAAVIAGILRELRWDAEEDLSKLIGDVAAHRLVQAGRSFSAWQREVAVNVAESAAEFWTEEQPVLASQRAAAEWSNAVDEMRDAAERLEKRIERLSRTFPSR
jgi:ubiquinone biosynthesis accessory factor UbiJ